MEWLLLLLNVVLVTSLKDSAPTTKASFTVTVEYSCRDWDPAFPNICQTPKYNMTQPLKLSIDGIGDVFLPCNYLLGKGYGKGQHLSTFLYHIISRIASISNRRRFYLPEDSQTDVVDELFEKVPLNEKPHFPVDRVRRQAFKSWDSLSLEERVLACGTRYDLGRTYQGFTSCPPGCVYCLAPERRYGQLLRWHEGNGICLRPQLLLNAHYWCIPGISCPDWFSRFSYIYLSNEGDDDNPCSTPAVTHTDGDVTRLTCVPKS